MVKLRLHCNRDVLVYRWKRETLSITEGFLNATEKTETVLL